MSIDSRKDSSHAPSGPLGIAFVAVALLGHFGGLRPQSVTPHECPPITAPDGIDTLVVQCGVVTVPQSRDPSDDLVPVELPVTIFSQPRTPDAATPVVYLAGGPGSSAIDEVANSFLNSATGRSLIRDHPIIAFDQRGFAGEGRVASPSLDATTVDTATVSLQQLYPILRENTQRLRSTGIDPRHFGTVDAALDVGDVARALHRDRVILFGTSYGTRVALQVMRREGSLVEAAILDGVVPFEILRAYDLGLANVLRWRAVARLVDDCRIDSECLSSHPHIAQDWARLAWDTTAVEISGAGGGGEPARLSGASLLAALGALLKYDGVAEAAPTVLSDLATGKADRDDLLDLVVPAALKLSADVSSLPRDWIGYLAVVCAEAPLGITELGGPELCAAMDVSFASLDFLTPVTSAAPTLVLAGRYDSITAPEWARWPERTMANAYAVELPGVGHVTHVQPSTERCVAKLVAGFLEARTRPPEPRTFCTAKHAR